MKELFKEEIAAEDEMMREAAVADMARPSPAEKEVRAIEVGLEKPKVSYEEEVPKTQKKRSIQYAAIAVLLVVIVVVFAFWFKGKSAKIPSKEVAVKSPEPSVSQPTIENVPTKTTPPVAKESEKASTSHSEAKALQEQAIGLMEKNPQEAKSLLLKAIGLDPTSIQAHFQLGLAYMKLKDFPKAIENYQKVAELNPKFTDAFFNLGYLYAIKKDYSTAERMYERVVQLAPSYLDEAYFNLGIVQEKQGKKKESIENLERALSVNPNNEKARKFLEKLKQKT
jgi:tetratricopeptide (TPR) repeat protein